MNKPSKGINVWSCCYCNKGSLNYQEASRCEQVHLNEFNQFPSSITRSICRCLRGRTWAVEPTIEALWIFLGSHFCPGEQVSVQISGIKYPAIVVNAEWPSYEVSLYTADREQQFVTCTHSAITRSARFTWTRRILKILLRIVMLPKRSYTDPFQVKPEHAHLLEPEPKGSAFEVFVQEMSDSLNYTFQFGQKNQNGGQQRLDSYFNSPDSAVVVPIENRTIAGLKPSTSVTLQPIAQIPPLKLPEWNREKGTNSWNPSLTNEFLFTWNFVVSFGGVELNIFPFRLQEYEAALLDNAVQEKQDVLRTEPSLPISNEILFALHKRLLRALAKERQERGKNGLQRLLQDVMPLLDFKMLNPVEFEMENEALNNFFTSTADTRELFWQQQDESDKQQKVRWYMDKFDSSNWIFMLVGFFLEVLPDEVPADLKKILFHLSNHPFDYPLLSLGQKLFIIKLLVEMALSLPVCRVAIDSFTGKVHEAKKDKRAAESEAKKMKKELDSLEKEKSTISLLSSPLLTSQDRSLPNERSTSSQPDRAAAAKLNKEIRSMTNKLEHQERMIKRADNEICKWNCVRVAPIGVDRNDRSYWIFDYWGPNVEAGDSGRLYVQESNNFTFFYDTIEQLDTLISSLKQQSSGRKEKELLKELGETYYEHLCNSMKKYYTPPRTTESTQLLSDDSLSDSNKATTSASQESTIPKSAGVGRRKGAPINPKTTFMSYTNRWDKQ